MRTAIPDMYQNDAIRQRYGFKELRIANWQDPRQSVHPARGGSSTTATIAGDVAGRPFVPYKVKYRAKPVVPYKVEYGKDEEGDETIVSDQGEAQKEVEAETQGV
jgi:hypothetical protein